jgi:hypothetical protein
MLRSLIFSSYVEFVMCALGRSILVKFDPVALGDKIIFAKVWLSVFRRPLYLFFTVMRAASGMLERYVSKGLRSILTASGASSGGASGCGNFISD